MKKTRYKMVALASLFLLILAGITTIPGVNSSPFRSFPVYYDYSRQGENYAALKGLELKAHSVKFIGTEKAKILNADVEFKNFGIVAPITVQTSCNYVSGTFETTIARYKLSVASDTYDVARQEFMRQIRAYWKAKNQEELKDYQYMPQEKFLWLNEEQYVLYLQPDNEWEGATYLFYASGQIIRLTFEGFPATGGWGGISSFVTENLIFKFPATKINAGNNIDISPTRFWELDRNGFFKNAPTSKGK